MTEKKNKARENVALESIPSQKLDRWIEQAEQKCNVRLSRKAMLNWYLAKSPENLSSSDLSQISEKFYDEERFLLNLIRKVRVAKKTGAEANVEVVVRQRRTKDATPSENDQKEDAPSNPSVP